MQRERPPHIVRVESPFPVSPTAPVSFWSPRPAPHSCLTARPLFPGFSCSYPCSLATCPDLDTQIFPPPTFIFLLSGSKKGLFLTSIHRGKATSQPLRAVDWEPYLTQLYFSPLYFLPMLFHLPTPHRAWISEYLMAAPDSFGTPASPAWTLSCTSSLLSYGSTFHIFSNTPFLLPPKMFLLCSYLGLPQDPLPASLSPLS